VEVLATRPKGLEGVHLVPNPVGRKGDEGGEVTKVTLVYQPTTGKGAAMAHVYDVSGQRVGYARQDNGQGAMEIEIGGLASGVYLVDFEYLQGNGNLRRKVLRLAVMR
jgi:hypothetical protein